MGLFLSVAWGHRLCFLFDFEWANKTFFHSLFLFFFYCPLAEEFVLKNLHALRFLPFWLGNKAKEGMNWILHLPVDSLPMSLHLFKTFNYTVYVIVLLFPSTFCLCFSPFLSFSKPIFDSHWIDESTRQHLFNSNVLLTITNKENPFPFIPFHFIIFHSFIHTHFHHF